MLPPSCQTPVRFMLSLKISIETDEGEWRAGRQADYGTEVWPSEAFQKASRVPPGLNGSLGSSSTIWGRARDLPVNPNERKY
jgi:hypothetical protein